MDDWKLPWEGGCRCGATRLKVTKPPLIAAACHCFECQRMSASAYSLTLSLPADGLEITRGEPIEGGGHRGDVHHMHCPECHSWMFTRIDALGWLVNLRPSMLDDHSWYAPYIEFFAREKLPWAETVAKHSFETAPEPHEFQPLMEAYASEGARP